MCDPDVRARGEGQPLDSDFPEALWYPSQVPSMGGVVGMGAAQLHAGTCKFLVIRAGGQVGTGGSYTSWHTDASGQAEGCHCIVAGLR